MKTDGGCPRVVGTSPEESPTSRCALASRVSESISRSTSIPWSRKYSAIVVAVRPALSLASGGSSDVATTTTQCRRLSPRYSRTKCSTSRPRSPTRAMTLTSAVEPRAIIEPDGRALRSLFQIHDGDDALGELGEAVLDA